PRRRRLESHAGAGRQAGRRQRHDAGVSLLAPAAIRGVESAARLNPMTTGGVFKMSQTMHGPRFRRALAAVAAAACGVIIFSGTAGAAAFSAQLTHRGLVTHQSGTAGGHAAPTPLPPPGGPRVFSQNTAGAPAPAE